MEILNVIKDHDIRWTCLTRCADLDKERAEAMEDAGCDIALFGVESLGKEVLKEARNRGIFTLGFLGNGGGEALAYCDSAFVVPSEVTARIQESHITAGHALLQYVEDRLLEDGWLTKT